MPSRRGGGRARHKRRQRRHKVEPSGSDLDIVVALPPMRPPQILALETMRLESEANQLRAKNDWQAAIGMYKQCIVSNGMSTSLTTPLKELVGEEAHPLLLPDLWTIVDSYCPVFGYEYRNGPVMSATVRYHAAIQTCYTEIAQSPASRTDLSSWLAAWRLGARYELAASYLTHLDFLSTIDFCCKRNSP